MAIDVNKPSSSDYPTKLTPPVSPPPCRDHQHNNNQAIPTITTKVHNIPPDISPGNFASNDFHLWEDEHYEAEDRADESARPPSKWILLAAALDADIFAPIEETPTATITENTLETPTHTPTMIESDPPADNIRIDDDDTSPTTIEEAAEQQQQTRHTQSKDRPVPVISNKNTNKNKKTKKMQKKATLKMTHMPAIIEEEPNSPTTEDEEAVRTTNTASGFNIIENTTFVHTTTTTDTNDTNNTTGDEEEIPIPTGMFDIDDEFTTSNTTEEEDDEKSNNFYDNIDNEILRNEESTIVFEDNTSATDVSATNNQSIPMTTANDIISKISQLFPATTAQDRRVTKAVLTFVEEFEAYTVEDGLGVLLEDPFDYDTRETVRGILMEDMLSDFDMDETRRTSFCDILFGLLDTKQQQQTNKTITPPKDQQVPVILNNKTKKTKRKQTQKKATPPKTKTKTIYAIKRPIVTVEEVNQYLQHVQNNPDLDEFPMNNLPIRTQIAQCEVAYYKFWNTIPGLAE